MIQFPNVWKNRIQQGAMLFEPYYSFGYCGDLGQPLFLKSN